MELDWHMQELSGVLCLERIGLMYVSVLVKYP